MSTDELRHEARAAWGSEAERIATPSTAEACVLWLSVAAGAFTLGAVALRLSLLFQERPAAVAVVLAVGASLAVTVVVVPLLFWRRRRAGARAAVESARTTRRGGASCPRCDAPLLAQALEEAGERRCGACNARLLEAEGLLVVGCADARTRGLRWRAQARSRLGLAARPRPSAALSPALWTTASVGLLGALWGTGAALGGTPPSTVEAPLALDRQISMHGTARAHDVSGELPPGPATRPRAPLWAGTQVLARRGESVQHELAVIVRVEAPRAFVVYASGGSAWVRGRDVLSPELAAGDAVELAEGARWVPAELVARVGTALRVRPAGGRARWTSAAWVRVRSDARHRAGVGLESEIPAGAWIEARVPGGLRPGLALGRSRDNRRERVVFSAGIMLWVERSAVRPQAIGPGVRVRVDGSERPVIVATRVGDALSVVDARGRRSWTSLARVRRDP